MQKHEAAASADKVAQLGSLFRSYRFVGRDEDDLPAVRNLGHVFDTHLEAARVEGPQQWSRHPRVVVLPNTERRVDRDRAGQLGRLFLRRVGDPPQDVEGALCGIRPRITPGAPHPFLPQLLAQSLIGQQSLERSRDGRRVLGIHRDGRPQRKLGQRARPADDGGHPAGHGLQQDGNASTDAD